MKVGVLLSGCGVYDGSEIHETVFALLALKQNNAEAICFAPNVDQHHVVNHLNGDEMSESRNVLVESARIARGDIKDIKEVLVNDIDALFIPGGFGAAKNLSKWAFNGPEGEILDEVKQLIVGMVEANKPVAGVCMGPTLIAKALEQSNVNATLTVGTTKENSPYEIEAISNGMESLGATAVMKTVSEVAVDPENKIVTAPCYMMEANIAEIHDNVQQAVKELLSM